MRFFFLNLGHFQTHLFLLLYPTVVLALEAEGGQNYGDLLLPSTALWVAFAAFTLPAAWAGDRFSKVRLITLLFFLLAIGGALSALADGSIQLMIGLSIIGVAGAIYHPVGIALVAEEAAHRTGRALGINGVWGNLGVAAAPLAAALLSEAWGWRSAFAVPAALALVTALLHLRLDRPEARKSKAEKKASGALTAKKSDVFRILAFLMISGFCGGMIFNTLTIALPKLLADALGSQGALQPGALAGGIFALASFTQIFSGHLLDRISARKLAGTITLFQAALLAILGLSDGWAAVAVALLLVMAIFGEAPVADTLVKRVTSEAIRSRAYGVLYLLSFGSSIAAVPLIAGLYGQGEGFSTLLFILAGGGALVSLSAWALPASANAP